MTKINELTAGMGDVELEGEIASVSEPRSVQTKYGPNTVASADLKDDTGTIKVTLWGNQIASVKAGDKVKLAGCFIKEYNGELQVAVTRNGSITVQ